MAIIQLPQRGQPLDVNYLYQVASAINQLSDLVTPATSKYVTIQKPSGSTSVKISESRIFAGFKQVVTDETVTAENNKEIEFKFDTVFATPPIVTATAINTGATSSTIGSNVIVTVVSVTTSAVKVNVRFNSAGKVSVGLNVIAIGQ